MANVYSNVVIQPFPSVGDPLVTITAQVNGTPVSIQVWKSVLTSNLATAIAFQNFLQPLLLAAFNALQTSSVVPPITGFTV